MDKIELGDSVRDLVTGFTGVVVAITNWLFGCVRVTVQPQGLHEGKPLETQTFDVQSVRLVAKGAFAASDTGGPQNDKAALRR